MWHMNGEYCPEGTIPKLRSSATDIHPKNTYDRLRTFNTASSNGINHPELATVFTKGLEFYGMTATMSIWDPKVNPSESTTSQVWLTNDGEETIEAIEAGWMVSFNFFCYTIGPDHANNWWLDIKGTVVGYWPAMLFEKLKNSAQRLQWGGRVVNTRPQGIHTSTEMGSGHFPREGQGRAAWFHNLKYMDAFGILSHATDVEGQATRPECYDVKVQPWDKDLGATFLYGGPGYSPSCQ
ncbi:hypothetical protein LINGRAHAP2_LOCUS12292 [Linum grandiflorum]